jgi:DNA invertase Pin-like site-specific DNA recombinase
MPKYAYSYIRFSSGRQVGNDSVRRQVKLTGEYCVSKGMVLVEDVFADLGVSGWKGDNLSTKNPAKKPALLRFMEMCSDGTIPSGSALVVEALDRISRQEPWKAIGTLSEIRNFGIEIHVTMTGTIIPPAGEGIDDHRADQALQEAVWAVIAAHRESAKKSKRLREAFAAKRTDAAKGEGFVSKSLPWWLTFKDDEIAPIAKRAAVLKEIFSLTSKGWSSQRIARHLNKRKVPTWRPKAKEWEDSRIRQIIMSEAPQGTLLPTPKTIAAGGEAASYRIEGYYPRIVTDSLAIKARVRMKENTVADRNLTPKNDRPVNLFKGILRYKGRWCRHQAQRNGVADEDGVKSWNSYYDNHDPNHEGKKTWSIAGAQLEEVILRGIMELTPEDLSAPKGKAVRRSVKMREIVLDLGRQVGFVVDAITRNKGSMALEKRLKELEAAEAKEKARLEEAEMQEARPQRESVAADLKILSPDLRDPEVRPLVARALQRLISRIDVGDGTDDLPGIQKVMQGMIDGNMYGVGHLTQDSLPKRSKRRRTIYALISFRDGGFRFIARSDRNSFINSARFVKKPEDPTRLFDLPPGVAQPTL